MKVQKTGWYRAQYTTNAALRKFGVKCRYASYNAPFDLYTLKGMRLEVRWTQFRKARSYVGWKFTMHRHGRLQNETCDFYVLRCEVTGPLVDLDIGHGNSFYIIIPSREVTVKTITVRLLGLFKGDWAKQVDNFRQLVDFDKALPSGPVPINIRPHMRRRGPPKGTHWKRGEGKPLEELRRRSFID